MKTMFAITHVNKDGMRQLTFSNQGRNHYAIKEEAEKALQLFEPGLRAEILGARADTLVVMPVECYDHGDAVGIYFDEPKEVLMASTLTRGGYQQLVDEDLVWLRGQHRTLERNHIIMIVEKSVELLYGTPENPKTPPPMRPSP